MSGPIRKSISTTVRFAHQHLQDAKAITYSTDAPTADFYERLLQTVEVTRSKIHQSLATLEAAEEKWSTFLQKQHGTPAYEAEYKLFEENTSKDDSFLDCLEQLRSMVSELNIRKKTIRKSLARLGRQVPVKRETNKETKDGEKEHSSEDDLSESGSDSEADEPAHPSAGTPHQRGVLPSSVRIQLPKLEIPKFSGENILMWPHFWNSFLNSIDSQPLANIDKFSYLISYLEGAAASKVMGYAITPENYVLVKKMLEKTYGDRSIHKKRLYQTLQKLPPFKTMDEISTVADQLETILGQLKQQGENVTENTALEMLVENKLPKTLLLQICEKKQKEKNWNLERLREEIQNAALIRREAAEIQPALFQKLQPLLNIKTKQERHANRVPNSTIATVQYTKTSPNSERTPSCALCQQAHWTDNCVTYPTVKDRVSKAKDMKLCFKCLRANHQSTDCKRKGSCYHCKGPHNSAFCKKRKQSQAAHSTSQPRQTVSMQVHGTQDQQEHALENQVTVMTAAKPQNTNVCKRTDTLLLSKELTVGNPLNCNLHTSVIGLFDSGSQSSFVTSDVAEILQLPTEKTEEIGIMGFGAEEATRYQSNVVTVGIKLADGTPKTLQAYAVPGPLTSEITTLAVGPTSFDKLKNNKPASVRKIVAKPQLLVGMDALRDYIDESTTMHSHRSGFVLLDPPIGPIICGKGSYYDKLSSKKVQLQFSTLSTISDELEQFWNLETIGIREVPEQTDDDLAVNSFENTIRYVNNRYEVGWPWKSPVPALQDNFLVAFTRFQSLLRRFKHEPSLQKAFETTISDQLRRGVIEEVQPNDPQDLVYYMPYQAVIRNDHATTKIRLVYDASSKQKGCNSLNDTLLRGPILIPLLVGVLLRFRSYPIVVTGDLEKAFLSVALRREDRDTTRFLWIRDPTKPPTKENLITFRFQRIPFGVISSPFLLSATIHHHLRRSHAKIAQELITDTYVDNILLGAQCESEAKEKATEAKQLFATAGMNLRAFMSNCSSVRNCLSEKDQPPEESNKIFGIPWDVQRDELVIAIKLQKCNSERITKRQLLKHIASIYDPLGLISPVLLPGKIILQSLWKQKKDWDDVLDETTTNQLKILLSDWSDQEFRIKRNVSMDRSNFNELHAFTDASKDAYGAAIYLRTFESGRFNVNLVMAKSRLSPIKDISIPRLELLGVLIGTRLLKFVKEELKLNVKVHLWSDSQCTLAWLKTEKVLPRFILNRVKEIKEFNAILHYVPSTENPADMASRGTDVKKLKTASMWWTGPSFLQKSEEYWPKWDKPDKVAELPSDTVTQMKVEVVKIGPFIDWNRFSSWNSLLRTVAWICRFTRNCKRNSKIKDRNMRLASRDNSYKRQVSQINLLDADEIKSAKRKLLQIIQSEEADQLANIRHEKGSDGLYRCLGRINNAELHDETVRPIWIPERNRATDLLVLHEHEKLGHCGVASTLSQLRQNYWLQKGRANVRRTIKGCTKCKRWHAAPFKLPPMPQLPEERVRRTKPFQNVGLDYIGPFTIRKNNQKEKAWISLFTCLSVRAVHLEIVENMTAEAFLNALRRFCARRGVPEKIVCDNAPQFKVVSEVLKIAQSDTVRTYCSNQEITWSWISPFSPWQGGIYERIGGSVKTALKKQLAKDGSTQTRFPPW